MPAMGSQLTIGELDGGTPAQLLAKKFNRHTFWCGQSGSGKTYALGVVLEQLVVHTELPMLILDPNADFVRFGEPRPGAEPEAAARIAGADVRVLHSTSGTGQRLRTRYVDLDVPSKAAVLRLDPIADRDEYNALVSGAAEQRAAEVEQGGLAEALRQSPDPVERQLGLRIENLQLFDWSLWAWGEEAVTDVIDQRPAVTVMDLGGFAHAQEPKVAALAALEHLWNRRAERRPLLIVIDEAHNICPPDPKTAVEKALTQLVVQIAAEGRKFGLWLLLSTQRPSKIHPNVLSQCDNLGLMRMSSPGDLAELAKVFGYAPAELLSASPGFPQGRALFAGGFVDEAALVQVGARVTEEGGADVPVPLRK